MKTICKYTLSILLSCLLLFALTYTEKASAVEEAPGTVRETTPPVGLVKTALSDYVSILILSDYDVELNVGDTYRLIGVASDLKKVTWKSSDSKIVSVSSTGVLTAKKAGTAVITAKTSKAEAECHVTVNETIITLNKYSASLECGWSTQLIAVTSNGSNVKWKSSKKSVATVSSYGKVTAVKPGVTEITATADGKTVKAKITVVAPSVMLNENMLCLYRGETFALKANTSSGKTVTWKTNKSSVATVNGKGVVTAKKHGTAVITATLDGVSAECIINVPVPELTIDHSSLSLSEGETASLKVTVSSGNTPEFSSSNPAIAKVDEKGKVTAMSKGKAYIYASEDGAKVRCTVTVKSVDSK